MTTKKISRNGDHLDYCQQRRRRSARGDDKLHLWQHGVSAQHK